MAKRKKRAPKKPEFPAPLNMSRDLDDMKAQDVGCMTFCLDPLIGTFTVLTNVGHYDFLINETLANEMVQALREFLAGDSASLLDED